MTDRLWKILGRTIAQHDLYTLSAYPDPADMQANSTVRPQATVRVDERTGLKLVSYTVTPGDSDSRLVTTGSEWERTELKPGWIGAGAGADDSAWSLLWGIYMAPKAFSLPRFWRLFVRDVNVVLGVGSEVAAPALSVSYVVFK